MAKGVIKLRILGGGVFPGSKRSHLYPSNREERKFNSIHSGENKVKMEQRETWPQVKECQPPPNLEEARDGLCRRACRVWPCRYPDFGYLASGMVEEYISVILSPSVYSHLLRQLPLTPPNSIEVRT